MAGALCLGARLYVIGHTVLAFAGMLALARSLGVSRVGAGSGRAELCLRRSGPVPVLQRHLPGRRRLVALGPRGRAAGAAARRRPLAELAIVLAMQVHGAIPRPPI